MGHSKLNTWIRLSILLLPVILHTTCLRPDPISNETVVEIDQVFEINTSGWARDSQESNGLLYVAASQAGIQIWDVSGTEPQQAFEHNPGSEDINLIHFDPVNHLLLAADRRIVHYMVMDSTGMAVDSVYYEQTSALLDPKQLSDGNTQDFNISARDSQLVIYLTDNDYSDGLKRIFLTLEDDAVFGGSYWAPEGAKLVTGHMRGMDQMDDVIAVTVEEMGVALYRVSLSSVEFLAELDTPGEAIETAFYGSYLLVATDWAGLHVLSWDGSRLAEVASLDFGENVEHISLWNDIAVLSCGNDEVYLVDLSDIQNPEVDQFIATGYTYRSEVVNDRIYFSTREGVKAYEIAYR